MTKVESQGENVIAAGTEIIFLKFQLASLLTTTKGPWHPRFLSADSLLLLVSAS